MSTIQRPVLLILAIAGLLFTVSTASAQKNMASRVGSAVPIADLREHGHDGDFVAIEGTIVKTRGKSLFELEDDTGRMVVRIPDHLMRDLGTPSGSEVIRVWGKYGSKTMLDKKGETQGPATGGERSWGIRVQRMARNLEESHGNPTPADSQVDLRPITPSETPAAINESNVIVPKASTELKGRMRVARQRALNAQSTYEDAQAEYARGLHRKAEGNELEGLIERRDQAERELVAATEAVPPLAQEAREAGVDESLVQLYENGITTPKR